METHKASYFYSKYPKEIEAARPRMGEREFGCLESLMDYGMTEEDFLAHVVSIEASKLFLSRLVKREE
jgi:hypothetical protein